MNRPFFERHNRELNEILRALTMVNDDRCGSRPQSAEVAPSPNCVTEMMSDSESLVNAIEREVQLLLESSCLNTEVAVPSGAIYANAR